MNGDEVNRYLERGVFAVVKIKRLEIDNDLSNPLPDMNFVNGYPNSVTEQAVRIDAVWHDNNGTLSLSLAPNGPGLWIPWIESSPRPARGVATVPGNGLGTYTQVLNRDITWVATGPFSGCYAVSFNDPASNQWVFAHIVTGQEGHPAQYNVDEQITHIRTLKALPEGRRKQVTVNDGAGYVFWTLRDGKWCRRTIWAWQGEVKHVGKREDE